MPYIPSSTKIPIFLAAAPFLFILISVLCLSVFLLWYQVYAMLLSPQEVHIQQHIHKKDLNLCRPLYYYGKVIVELEKTQTRNLIVFMVLVLCPSSTLKFLFAFGFN